MILVAIVLFVGKILLAAIAVGLVAIGLGGIEQAHRGSEADSEFKRSGFRSVSGHESDLEHSRKWRAF